MGREINSHGGVDAHDGTSLVFHQLHAPQGIRKNGVRQHQTHGARNDRELTVADGIYFSRDVSHCVRDPSYAFEAGRISEDEGPRSEIRPWGAVAIIEIEFQNEDNSFHTSYRSSKYPERASRLAQLLRDKLDAAAIRHDVRLNPGPGRGFMPYRNLGHWFQSQRDPCLTVRYPRFGAFEVLVRYPPLGSGRPSSFVAWSKLQERSWPDLPRLAKDVVGVLTQARLGNDVSNLILRLQRPHKRTDSPYTEPSVTPRTPKSRIASFGADTGTPKWPHEGPGQDGLDIMSHASTYGLTGEQQDVARPSARSPREQPGEIQPLQPCPLEKRFPHLSARLYSAELRKKPEPLLAIPKFCALRTADPGKWASPYLEAGASPTSPPNGVAPPVPAANSPRQGRRERHTPAQSVAEDSVPVPVPQGSAPPRGGPQRVLRLGKIE